MDMQEVFRIGESFRFILSQDVFRLLKGYQSDITVDLQVIYHHYIEHGKFPERVVLYVRDHGTHIFLPNVSTYDTGDYISNAMSGYGPKTTVFVIELKEVQHDFKTRLEYVVSEKAPFLDWWPENQAANKAATAPKWRPTVYADFT